MSLTLLFLGKLFFSGKLQKATHLKTFYRKAQRHSLVVNSESKEYISLSLKHSLAKSQGWHPSESIHYKKLSDHITQTPANMWKTCLFNEQKYQV